MTTPHGSFKWMVAVLAMGLGAQVHALTPTTTKLTTQDGAPLSGQSITMTATVTGTGGTPTGTVLVKDMTTGATLCSAAR